MKNSPTDNIQHGSTKPMLGEVASDNKVLICNNCKDIWITPKDRCDCGCTTLTETHESNRKLARNFA